jgi:DNA repair exonuclease SbcCD ATPase subunit
MLSRLHIQNFESHQDTEVEFAPGVNVIVGLSDAGKSALFRSANWALFNRPSGDGFIRQGESTARVEVELDGRHSVIRRKGKSVNSYHLDEQEFKAFGNDVPEEIAQTVNMDRGMNVQGQVDPLYLLQSSPGEVARHFNAVAGLDAIDTSMSNLQSWERAAKKDLDRDKKQAQSLEEDLAQYGHLEDLEGKLAQAEQQQEQLDELRGRAKKLRELVWQARSSQDRIRRLQKIVEWKPEVDRAEQIYSQVKEKYPALRRLRKATKTYRDAQDRVAALQDRAALKSEVDAALADLESLKQKRETRKQWHRAAKAVAEAQESVESAQGRLDELEEQWHREAPDTCPMCNGTGRLQ